MPTDLPSGRGSLSHEDAAALAQHFAPDWLRGADDAKRAATDATAPGHFLTREDTLLLAAVYSTEGDLRRAAYWGGYTAQIVRDGRPPLVDEPEPVTIRTANNRTVRPGDAVFNYYDQKWGRIAHDVDSEGWFHVNHHDGTSALLNGERISTVDYQNGTHSPYAAEPAETEAFSRVVRDGLWP